jgi:Polyketide cyclase / dehydrase and lipid transport
MSEIAWQLEHSVEADVSPTFAWNFMADVKNWDDPPAEFTLEGPFVAGSRGTTLMPGQPPMGWHIREVEPRTFYAVEAQLDRAVLSFEWRFEAASDERTLLKQRIILAGENAALYVGPVEAAFGANLTPGMTRIAEAMRKCQQQSGFSKTQS